jgi:hypothetical protein
MSDIKATVREYTVVKKVVVLEISEEECQRIVGDGGEDYTLNECGRRLVDAVDAALADKAREDSEDVPF